jgi:hypothetical protein
MTACGLRTDVFAAMGRLPLPLAGEGRGGGLRPFRLHERQRLPIRRFTFSTSPPQAGERAGRHVWPGHRQAPASPSPREGEGVYL